MKSSIQKLQNGKIIFLNINKNKKNMQYFEKKTPKCLVNKKRPITFASAFKQVLQGCEKKVKKNRK